MGTVHDSRKVFTGIVGSSVFETAARTSGYGESLMETTWVNEMRDKIARIGHTTVLGL